MPLEHFDIVLAHDSDRERRTREQLERILATHDVGRWIRTRHVVIEERAIPHSHPKLTLNTRHLDDDDLLLATFVHEQLHWLVLEHQGSLRAAISEIRAFAPDIPVGFPRGADSKAASYLHVVVNYLEGEAMEEVLGSERARRVLDHWMRDHYTGIYELVSNEAARLRTIIERRGLRP